ncbi:Hexamethylene bis-acetamide-inducible family protein [Acanthocheilonema viteae]
MTATVVDHPDKQQDQEHTSKQHLSQQLQPEHNIVVASMEGTDDEVAVAVSLDIPTDASHHAVAEQDLTKEQHYSKRIPDTRILSASALHTKAKKSRRRRGGKGRWKPYHTLSVKEKIVQEEKEERNAVEKRERLFSRGKPMAPYNTTQFLLEDHEKRTMPPDVGDSCSGIAVHQRQSTGGSPTRERFGTIGHSGSEMGGNTTDSASYSGVEDDEMERQFDADYDYVNMERISNMTKDEVVREYMHLEKINGKLADRVSLLQLENDKLKQLLKDHNISYENVLPKIRRHSGASVSEAGDVIRKSLDEAVLDSGQ